MKECIIFRVMDAGDYAGAYKLWSSLPGVGLRSLDDSLEGIKKFLERNPKTCFIALRQDELVGTILCGHDGRRGYIYHAAVKPELRRIGIGKRLVKSAIDALRKEGINKAALVAFVKNSDGIEFWTSMGFEKRPDLEYMNIGINTDNV